MKPALAVTASVATLLIGMGAGSLWKDIDLQQERRLSASKSEGQGLEISKLEGSVKSLAQELDDARSNSGKLEEALKAAQTQLAQAAAKGAEGNGRAAAPQGGGEAKNLGKMLAEMMNDPEMKGMMKQQQAAQIDMLYGGLYNRLHLNDADKQELKKMIAERVQGETELSLRLMEAGMPEDQKKTVFKALTDAKDASDLKIKSFLNNEQDYQMFQSWEGSKAERMALTLGHAAFSAVGEPLTTLQEDQLVNSMTSARTRRTDVPDLSNVQSLASLSGDEKEMARVTAAFNTQAQEVYAAAASFLTPKQLEALKTMQEQQQAMQAAGLKMGASMFNKKK